MGTESLGVIGCIFAENGPLEGGIESSFWGTGWGAKGDFMRYSYLYPYIFESRTHTFFESTCPELYAQQSWEWSDAYSWRNDLWKVNFKRVCEKTAGVLMVIWSGVLAPIRSFSKVAPILHQIWKIAPILHQIWKYRYKVANNYSIYAVEAFLQNCDYVTDGSTQMPKSQKLLRPTGLLTKNRAA